MKKLKHLLILLLGFSIGGIGCNKIEKADPTVGLLFSQLVSQVSGACAEVSKSGTTYLARLTPVPKGGCNAATIYAGSDADSYANTSYENLKTFLKTVNRSNCNTLLSSITNLESSIKGIYKNAYNNARDNTKVRFYGIDSIKSQIDTYKDNPFFNTIETLPLDGYKQLATEHGYRSILAGIYASCNFSDGGLSGLCGAIRQCVDEITTYLENNAKSGLYGKQFQNVKLEMTAVPVANVNNKNIVSGLSSGYTSLFNNFDPFITPDSGISTYVPLANSVLWSVVCDYGSTKTPLAVDCSTLNEQF